VSIDEILKKVDNEELNNQDISIEDIYGVLENLSD